MYRIQPRPQYVFTMRRIVGDQAMLLATAADVGEARRILARQAFGPLALVRKVAVRRRPV